MSEGPTTYTIPSRRRTTCGMCKHHKCIGSFHVRCGEGGWREYVCTHPESFERVGNVAPEVAEAIGRARQMEIANGGGRHIGKTEETPEWCPFLRKAEAVAP